MLEEMLSQYIFNAWTYAKGLLINLAGIIGAPYMKYLLKFAKSWLSATEEYKYLQLSWLFIWTKRFFSQKPQQSLHISC